eukprot:3938062-Rhodomonas_salina.1
MLFLTALLVFGLAYIIEMFACVYQKNHPEEFPRNVFCFQVILCFICYMNPEWSRIFVIFGEWIWSMTPESYKVQVLFKDWDSKWNSNWQAWMSSQGKSILQQIMDWETWTSWSKVWPVQALIAIAPQILVALLVGVFACSHLAWPGVSWAYTLGVNAFKLFCSFSSSSIEWCKNKTVVATETVAACTMKAGEGVKNMVSLNTTGEQNARILSESGFRETLVNMVKECPSDEGWAWFTLKHMVCMNRREFRLAGQSIVTYNALNAVTPDELKGLFDDFFCDGSELHFARWRIELA